MNIRVNDLRRGWRWSYLVPTMWVVVSFLSAPFSAQAATTSLQPRTVLRITAPKQVKVGQPIQLDLTLVGATAIAGYETHVLFDTTAGHFSGLRQRNNDLKQTGRDVSPLTVSELSDGVAIGFYSCAQADCVTRKGPRQRQGGRGTLKLASLVIDTYREGTLSIVLSSTRFVDQQGGTIAVDIPSPHVAVQIGSPSTPVRLTAPRPRWRLANGVQGTNGPFDLNGDGIVSHADAMEVALAWTAVRERGQPCSTQQYASRDVNHDGCIDVADAQLVATNYSNNTAGGVPAGAYRHNAAPLSLQALGEWTVDTEIDSNDANIGDGVCQANVTSTGKCTLRAAIQEANARQGPDAIGFTIPGSGVRLIQLKSALPALSDLSGPTTIDGYTQAGTSPNTDPIVSNAVIGIEIRGTGATGFDGLPITSSGNIIRGLSFYNLRRSLFLNGSGATNNRIVGNFIGTNAAATFQSPTSVLNANGVDLAQGAANNRIGDVAAADRNVISGNARNGIATYYEYTDANIILNNIVGLHPLGTNRLTNQANGIDINSYSSYNIIGGTDVGQLHRQ
jgi:CSLREA domain-containing protein